MEYNTLEKTKEFLNWISTKLGINIKMEHYLGNGTLGIVYSIDKFRVIKFTSDVSNIQPFINKNLDGLVKIYSYGEIQVPKKFKYDNDDVVGFYININEEYYLTFKETIGYIIMERIEIGDVQLRLEKIINFFKGSDIFINIPTIYKNCDDNIFLDLCYKKFEEIDEEELVESAKKEYEKIKKDFWRLIKIYQNISKHGYWDDVHKKQFGVNKNGDLVAFDYTNYDETRNYTNKYKSPKNLVKETKYIKLFEEYNKELKQYLYHSTTIENVISILKFDKLITSEINNTISFTRNKNFWLQSSLKPIRLVLDREKITQHYKLYPYNYFQDPQIFPDEYAIEKDIRFEFEEVVKKDIVNLHNYLIIIEININAIYDMETLKKIINEYIIKYPNIEVKYYNNLESINGKINFVKFK